MQSCIRIGQRVLELCSQQRFFLGPLASHVVDYRQKFAQYFLTVLGTRWKQEHLIKPPKYCCYCCFTKVPLDDLSPGTCWAQLLRLVVALSFSKFCKFVCAPPLDTPKLMPFNFKRHLLSTEVQLGVFLHFSLKPLDGLR